jgi:hypothetical protein
MTRKYKALGVALMAAVAALAFSGIAASSAMAVPKFTCVETVGTLHFHVHCTAFGTQVAGEADEFTAGSGFGAIRCTNATFSGGTNATGESTTEETHPSYSSCSDSFGRTVDVSTTGCNYLFHVTTKLQEDEYQGTSDVVCEAGKLIELKVTSGGSTVCTVTIGSQTGTGPHKITNMTGSVPTDVTIMKQATNVHSTTSGGFFNCGISNGEHTEGTYTGNTTVIGRNTANEQVDIEVSG